MLKLHLVLPPSLKKFNLYEVLDEDRDEKTLTFSERKTDGETLVVSEPILGDIGEGKEVFLPLFLRYEGLYLRMHELPESHKLLVAKFHRDSPVFPKAH